MSLLAKSSRARFHSAAACSSLAFICSRFAANGVRAVPYLIRTVKGGPGDLDYKVKVSRKVVFDKEVTDATVFRVGGIDATYYLVGKSQSGNWVGVKTEATET